MKRIIGLTIFFLLLLLFVGIFVLILSQEMTHQYWSLAAGAIAWSFLMGIWYLFFGKASLKQRFIRFGTVLVLFLLSGFLASRFLEYDGSASGSSFPKFRWVWEDENPKKGNTSEQFVQGGISPSDPELRQAIGESIEFLGPERNGMQKDLPYNPDWNANPPELVWRRSIGKAWSSFAVKDGMAITQEQSGNSERVICLDIFSGKEIWHHENKGIRLLEVKEENAGTRMGGDGPRSTPVIGDGKVFALGSTGILNCLDLQSGKKLWQIDTLAIHAGEVQKWGMANAPLLLPDENIIVVPGTDRTGVTLAAYSPDDGSTVWTYSGEGSSYSSPRILTILGVRQIVSTNRQSVSGHNPATGERLWIEEWPGTFPKVAQPILVGSDRILATASYGAGSLLLKLSHSDSEWNVERLWSTNRMKTKFSSPVIRDGIAYGIDEGRLASIDLATGGKIWKKQKVGFGQQLLLNDHLLIQTETGPVITGPVDEKGFTETGRIDALSSMTWNAPTLAGRVLLVRNDKEAACYLLPAPQSKE